MSSFDRKAARARYLTLAEDLVEQLGCLFTDENGFGCHEEDFSGLWLIGD